jgi:hypothetical protein
MVVWDPIIIRDEDPINRFISVWWFEIQLSLEMRIPSTDKPVDGVLIPNDNWISNHHTDINRLMGSSSLMIIGSQTTIQI